MDNNPHGLDDLHDEENGFSSSDGEGDHAMYGIRAPRRSAAREWHFDSLRISHMMDMHEMLQILEDIISYIFSHCYRIHLVLLRISVELVQQSKTRSWW